MYVKCYKIYIQNRSILYKYRKIIYKNRLSSIYDNNCLCGKGTRAYDYINHILFLTKKDEANIKNASNDQF